MNDIAICAKNITKKYALYSKPWHRLIEALHPFRKKCHHDFYALNDVSFKIKKGDVLADTSSTVNGQISIGQNIFVNSHQQATEIVA